MNETADRLLGVGTILLSGDLTPIFRADGTGSMTTMPDRVREAYEPLWQAVGVLHLNWKLYHQVYGAGPERIKLLNEFAPNFFRAAQDSMLDGTFLAMSRLTDPPRSVGKDNLVLERRVVVAEESEPGLPARLGLSVRLQEIRNECVVFRTIRNKRLAHSDLKAALGQRAEGDGPMTASRQHVENALKAIREFMNAFRATTSAGRHAMSTSSSDLETVRR